MVCNFVGVACSFIDVVESLGKPRCELLGVLEAGEVCSEDGEEVYSLFGFVL